jgi:hypothetical protein
VFRCGGNSDCRGSYVCRAVGGDPARMTIPLENGQPVTAMALTSRRYDLVKYCAPEH